MLSEASDIDIYYALLLCIKANVKKEESYTVCDYSCQQQSPLCVSKMLKE